MIKRIFFLIFIIFFSRLLPAQKLALQIAPGLMNYGGDLQNNVYTFNQADFSLAAGLVYSMQNFSLRGNLAIGKIKGNDRYNTKFKYRNLSFFSNISDINFCLQYDFNLTDNNTKFNPYIFTGIGVFHFNPYTYYNSTKIYLRELHTEGEGLAVYPDKKLYSLTQFEIPFGIGVKYKLSEHVLLGVEFNSRFLFTDYLDDVSTKYPDENELFKAEGQLAVDLSFRGNEIDPSLTFPSNKPRGNSNQNDNYYTSSLVFTYILPQHFLSGSIGKSKKSKQLDCPKNIR